MTEFERERLFEQMAKVYVRTDGAALLEEDDARLIAATPRLDVRVRRAIGAHRFARWLPGISAIAAGLLLVFFIGRLMPMPGESAGLSPAEPQTADVILLNFSLPDNLEVASVQEDRGQTVYHLHEALGDDVVLTLAYREDEGDFSALRPVALGGETVYAASEDGYHLLTFEHDGVRYELTCQYELNTIAKLAERILL